MEKHNFGKKLKKLRVKEGLLQRELAERTGLQITTIANYEINRREPKANQIKLLAQALGVEMGELFTQEGDGQNGRGAARRYLIAEVFLRMSHRVVHALTINMSNTGIGVYADERINSNEDVIVTLKVLVNRALETAEEVPGTVVWCSLVGKRYAAGISFKKTINDKEFPILAKCIGEKIR